MVEIVGASLVTATILSGLVALIGVLLWRRLDAIAAVLRDGAPVSGWDADQLRLPLRFVA